MTTEWNARSKHWDLPEFRGRKHQTRPHALFSSISFLLREKRYGRRRRVRTGLDGTSPRCSRSLFSSEPVSSFPSRKLNLRFGFYGKSATTSQALRASSPGRGAKGPLPGRGNLYFSSGSHFGSGSRCIAPKTLLLRSGYCACSVTISSLTSCRLVCLSAGQTLWTTGSA